MRQRDITTRKRSRKATWAAVAISASILSGCVSPPSPPAPTGEVKAEYTLGPGDEVRVDVFGEDAMSREYTVDGDGLMAMPLVGAVSASSLTAKELERRLQQKLSVYMRDPKVSVAILSYRPFYIVGEVRKPGSYPFVDGMTVINAVAIAGGFTYRARTSSFQIRRKGNEPDETVVAGQAWPVNPGDVIVVQERFF